LRPSPTSAEVGVNGRFLVFDSRIAIAGVWLVRPLGFRGGPAAIMAVAFQESNLQLPKANGCDVLAAWPYQTCPPLGAVRTANT